MFLSIFNDYRLSVYKMVVPCDKRENLSDLIVWVVRFVQCVKGRYGINQRWGNIWTAGNQLFLRIKVRISIQLISSFTFLSLTLHVFQFCNQLPIVILLSILVKIKYHIWITVTNLYFNNVLMNHLLKNYCSYCWIIIQ